MGCVAKLCDLGWAACIITSRKTYCGTFDYVPPEILERKDYDLSVDIWCLGILTYELLIGKVPYTGDRQTSALNKINNVIFYLIT
jgi:serine/threonine protein kinase